MRSSAIVGGMHWRALIVVAALAACAPPRSNVLLIVADDVGIDVLRMYGTNADLPPTPALDRLAAEGVVFENVWSNPLCSSTRATIQTGRYTFRTGVADVVSGRTTRTLPLDEWTLPEVLDRAGGGHAHAMLGKWHLDNRGSGGANGPNLAGYGHYSGSLNAFPIPSYARWWHTRDGVTTTTEVYATTQLVDEALDWIASRDGPWFLQIAFQAAHRPWHVPPPQLLSESTLARLPRDDSGRLADPGTTCSREYARPCYLAMIEAMSREIGRLLEALPAVERSRTHLLFVADNGTPKAVSGKGSSGQSKAQLYEGGIRVPLIIAGPAVHQPGRRSEALVNTADLFATVIELATGRSAASVLPSGVVLDASSLVPILADDTRQVREFAFAERMSPSSRDERDGRAIRAARFKLIQRADGFEELYDLERDAEERFDLVGSEDPLPRSNLLALRAALAALAPPLGSPRSPPELGPHEPGSSDQDGADRQDHTSAERAVPE